MSERDPGGRTEPTSPRRRATVDYMRMAGRRSGVHGLVGFDVTEARRRIRRVEAETGERLSFTAFVAFCLARTVEEHPHVQAYRDWRGRIHLFDDVDVNVLVETTADGERLGVPHVVRAANRRSLRSIHDEIRAVQDAPASRLPGWQSAAFRLPAVVRRQVWRLPQWFPRRWKRLAGTVAVTAVGMFGEGGGWAVSPTNYALQLTVGGIEATPRLVDGELVEREVLDLTLTFDHDVVDGAAAARFAQRLKERIEAADGVDGFGDPDANATTRGRDRTPEGTPPDSNSDPDADPVSVGADAGRNRESNPDTAADAPSVCPVCETAYDSVSVHDRGLMVNLLDNERYRRVCFEPIAGADGPLVRFYHHTHEQVGADDG